MEVCDLSEVSVCPPRDGKKQNDYMKSFIFSLSGLITLDELHHRVLKGRGKYAQDVSQ